MMQFNKQLKKCLAGTALTILSTVAGITAMAQEPVKVLFLGNSFTNANNTPELVKSFSESAGVPMIVQARMPGGCYVKYEPQGPFAHANNEEVYAMIRSTKWDYLVIQDNQGFFVGPVESEFAPIGHVTEGHAQLRDSLLQVNPCAKVILFSGWVDAYPMEWAPELGLATAQEANTRVFQRYQYLNEDIDQIIAPIGIAWNYVLDSMTSVNLFSADNSHPSYEGSYLAAATIFTTITRKKTTTALFNGTLSPALAMKMKEYAYKAVLENLEEVNLQPVLRVEGGMLLAEPGYAMYQWYRNGELMPEETAPGTHATPFTCFQLKVRDAADCEYTSLEYCFDEHITDLAGVNPAERIKCYPNPVTDMLTIEQEEGKILHTTAVIADVTGKVIEQFTINKAMTEVSLQHYAPGIYILKLANGATRKIVKQ